MPPQIENNLPPVNIEPKQKFPKWAKYLLIILSVLLVGTIVFIWQVNKFFNNYIEDAEKPKNLNTITTTTDQFSNWKTYRNEAKRFEINYPPSLTAREVYTHNVIVCFEDENRTLANELAVCIDDNIFPSSISTDNSIVFNMSKADCNLYKSKGATCSYVAYSSDASFLKEITSTFKFISTSIPTADISNWKTYRNEEYNFEFKYPDNHTAYKSVDAQKEVLIPSGPYDDYAAITENESALFCCEPITLRFQVIKVSSSYSWLSEDVNKYLGALENVRKQETMFAGKPAVIFTGDDNLGSIYKMYALALDNQKILLIEQGSSSNFLDQILSTFKFISTSTSMLGGDRDEHGCIGSAGYSWCEVKSRCLRVWEEKCE